MNFDLIATHLIFLHAYFLLTRHIKMSRTISAAVFLI